MELGDGPSAAVVVSGQEKFSIRDYVHEARTNGLSRSWPFPAKYLQLLMSHGISEALPPIEPGGLASCPSHTGNVKLGSQKLKKNPLVDSNLSCGVSIGGREGTCDLERETNIEEVMNVIGQVRVLSISDDTNIARIDRLSSEIQKNIDRSMLQVKVKEVREAHMHGDGLDISLLSQQKASKALTKSYLPETEVHSALRMTSTIHGHDGDSDVPKNIDVAETSKFSHPHFASKICSLNLNTSLQTTGRPKHKLRRRRGKPKKRSLVDIYAQAMPLSLENLHRRNGSVWAVNSSKMPYGNSNGEVDSFLNEQSRSMIYAENSNSEDGHMEQKHPRDDNFKEDNSNCKRRCTMLIKLKGNNLKPRKTKMVSFAPDESKESKSLYSSCVSEDLRTLPSACYQKLTNLHCWDYLGIQKLRPFKNSLSNPKSGMLKSDCHSKMQSSHDF